MQFKNNLIILDAEFNSGLFHIITESKIDIPNVIEYSKHSERHFIFYNCQTLIEEKYEYLDHSLKLKFNYRYVIEYERKFTSKDINNTISDFKSYIRNKKLIEIL